MGLDSHITAVVTTPCQNGENRHYIPHPPSHAWTKKSSSKQSVYSASLSPDWQGILISYRIHEHPHVLKQVGNVQKLSVGGNNDPLIQHYVILPAEMA